MVLVAVVIVAVVAVVVAANVVVVALVLSLVLAVCLPRKKQRGDFDYSASSPSFVLPLPWLPPPPLPLCWPGQPAPSLASCFLLSSLGGGTRELVAPQQQRQRNVSSLLAEAEEMKNGNSGVIPVSLYYNAKRNYSILVETQERPKTTKRKILRNILQRDTCVIQVTR